MFRPRRLLWLVIIAGIGYVAWRWREGQAAALPAPAPSPAPPPARPAAAPTAATAEAAVAAPAGPRRIITRVHRGAPPSAPLIVAAAKAPEEPPPAPTEPPAVVEQTLAPLSAEEAVAAPAEHEPPAAHEQTLAPLSAEEIPTAEETLGAAAAEPASPVNLNTADAQALIDLPGIGTALATRIIAYREAHGPFATVDDLIAIQGIGPNSINEFRHLITV